MKNITLFNQVNLLQSFCNRMATATTSCAHSYKRYYLLLTILLFVGVNNAWAGDRIYLKPNSNWTQNNYRFAAYFFKNNNGGDTWVSMFKEGDIYVCEIPSGYPNVIFCRMNGETSENKWDNKWNQSSDLVATNNEGKL